MLEITGMSDLTGAFLFAAADTHGCSHGKEDGPIQAFDTPRVGNWCE